MKKLLLWALLAVILISNTACLSGGSLPSPSGLIESLHACGYSCPFCQKCLDSLCGKTVCADKCEGHTEEVTDFGEGGFITEAEVSIDTGSAVIDLGANVYVRGDLATKTEEIVAALEKVSGLDFDGNGYGRELHSDGKVHISATRDLLYVDEGYEGSPHSETGSAYAERTGHAHVSPGDLLICGDYAVLHELSHVLMFRQQGWAHSQLLNEGFAEYTAYLAIKELQAADPSYAVSLGAASRPIQNMEMDALKMYEKPLEYWFDNVFTHSANVNYSIGFRFMAYLDDVYGDYAAWVSAFYESDPYSAETTTTDLSTTEQQITVLKATYGNGVLRGFYPWLKEHSGRFTVNHTEQIDLRGAKTVNWYPTFNAIESKVALENFSYRDLYVNVETARKYLADYKNCDVSALALKASAPVTVNFYRADGSFITVFLENTPVSLDGVSYIKLVGEGELGSLEIIGFSLPSAN